MTGWVAMGILAGDCSCRGSFPAPRGPVAAGRPGKADKASVSPASATVRIRLLGRFVVLRGAEEIPPRAFGGRLPQQLLRLLALQRGALIRKDVIAEALWPRWPRPTPGATLRCW